MKKMLSITLALLLAVALAACGTTDNVQIDTPTNVSSAPVQQSETAGTPNPVPPTDEKVDQEKADTTVSKIQASDLKPSEGLEFESNGDGTCTLVGIGICQDTDLVIPTESPEGDKLTLIEKYAFMSLEDVNSVTLLNYCYEVEDWAFEYGEMTAVNILGGTPVIGESAFASCEDLASITFQDCDLQLNKYAFLGSGKDAVVTFSNCTGTVDKYAFEYGDFISLTMDQCDMTMEEGSFSSCEALTSVAFRESNLSVGEDAFLGAGDSASMEVDNCTLTLEDSAFQYASLSELGITGPQVTIGDNAFGSCEDLENITIDCGTVSLGEDAFYGCDDLTTVSICDNGKKENSISIGNDAFQYCGDLASVTIGKGQVEVGDDVFYGCSDDLKVSINGKAYMALT